MVTAKDLQNALDEEGNVVPCQNAPNLFFPWQEEVGKQPDYSYAKKLCSTCPIMDICLAYAQDNGEYDGVWGGLSPAERRAMRRARRMVA